MGFDDFGAFHRSLKQPESMQELHIITCPWHQAAKSGRDTVNATPSSPPPWIGILDAGAERTQSKIYFKAAAHLEHPESLHLGMHPDLTGRHKEKDRVYYYVLRITAMSSAPRRH